MTEETENWRDGLDQKVADEIDCVRKAFRGSSDRRPEIKPARNDRGVDHLYVEGQILVRADHLDRVLEILGQPPGDALCDAHRGVAADWRRRAAYAGRPVASGT